MEPTWCDDSCSRACCSHGESAWGGPQCVQALPSPPSDLRVRPTAIEGPDNAVGLGHRRTRGPDAERGLLQDS
eukprot:15450268-Alexandrium_andersonii.AAC.1